MKMSENKDYIQLPPLKKDTPSDVVAFMWKYMKVPENSREKVKNLLKDANENGVKLSHQAPTLYDVVPKEEIAEFEELMRKTIADIVSEASSVAWLQRYDFFSYLQTFRHFFSKKDKYTTIYGIAPSISRMR